MDNTNINRIKNTQASFTGKAQETQRNLSQPNQTKDTKTIQQEIKRDQKTKEEQTKEQQTKDQIQQSQISRINLLRNPQKQVQSNQQQTYLYKQELQTLKGVLRNWVNGILNPSSNFNLIQNSNINENSTQRFVNTWLNSDARTIQNLERLLNLQLQLQPNNAEIYVKLQLVKLVKDAKKMVEEYTDTRNDPRLPKGEAEENQHCMITAGMMAAAVNRLRRKRNKSYTDIREEMKKELTSLGISEKKSYYENISRARKLLKDVERELFEAIKNGADQETINQIIEKVADIYSLLSELYTR
ncbi:MAG: hypothetical protein RMJ51_01190 [Candidatus Calescibacterium sp.]|nr:hypothetical protein [Candidatus Calescibacterium sp.]MCX7972158.1 hypothetical protein [bacterium]MDW8194847.1 hypothetical protein [Candidatus Calescibacterium sp.]